MMNAFSPLFFCFLIANGLLNGRVTQAQAIVAGQSSSATYVDLVPDKVLTAQTPGNNFMTDMLDLDGDGRFDLRLTARISPSSFPSSAEDLVMPLHDDVAICSQSHAPAVDKFTAGSLIQEIAPGSPRPGPVWGSQSTIYGPSWLVYRASNPAGYQNHGAWLDGQDGYLGVRLRTGTGWRYGWVRMQAQFNSFSTQVSMTVKDYALANPVLAQRQAHGSAWQLFPVPATDWLAIRMPDPGVVWLTIRDLNGRVCLSQQLAANGQVQVAALPTGMYLLQLQTATATATRQFVKQ